MAAYFHKDQSLSSSYVESSPNMMSTIYSHHHNNNNYSSSSSSPFQEISTNGEKQSNDFNSWRDNQLLLLHGGGGTQELSLSLSPHMQMPPFLGCSNLSISAHDNLRLQEDEHLNNLMQIDHISPHGGHGHGHGHISRSFTNSKYLRVAQELLDEVVNVRKALKRRDSNMELQQKKDNNTSPQDCSGSKLRTELSAVEKHNLQEKLTKLVAMLDEVDRRYKQYYNHMQIVVSSFETVAGNGAARPYTAVAVQTISRHFRSLREAITGQIKLTRKSLGEEEDVNGNIKGIGISRLRHVDQQLRLQKGLQQQLGIMQQHAWRPQRGLPENSVSILRAWLFEHFLHPYPKDSDKMVLARETGLTRSQVSNWFINARVRLWKPMVEEMYKEEFGIAEMGSKSSSDRGVEEMEMEMEMVPRNLTISEMGHDGSVFPDTIWFGNNGGGGGGGGVSLTLGLHNLGENYRLPISTGDLNQFNNTVRSDGHVYNINVGADAAATSSSSSHLLLHDFVA